MWWHRAPVTARRGHHSPGAQPGCLWLKCPPNHPQTPKITAEPSNFGWSPAPNHPQQPKFWGKTSPNPQNTPQHAAISLFSFKIPGKYHNGLASAQTLHFRREEMPDTRSSPCRPLPDVSPASSCSHPGPELLSHLHRSTLLPTGLLLSCCTSLLSWLCSQGICRLLLHTSTFPRAGRSPGLFCWCPEN